MITEYKVQPNQTLPDVVLMATGTMEAAMQIMAANNISIADIPATGLVVYIPNEVTIDNDTLSYLQRENVVIGTKG